MLPIGDDNRDRQRWPLVTAALVIANVICFFYELHVQAVGGEHALRRFIETYGVVPAEWKAHPTTLLTSMFLHGGWGHLLGNMLYLWVFGDNVEDRMRRIPFILFYVATGVVGALTQIAVNPNSTLPTIGASGAISGVLGAYLVMFPWRRVRVLFFILIYEVPAILVVGLWALTQLINTVGSLGARTTETGGVAYAAHLGAFATGALGGALWRRFHRGGGPGRRPRYAL